MCPKPTDLACADDIFESEIGKYLGSDFCWETENGWDHGLVVVRGRHIYESLEVIIS